MERPSAFDAHICQAAAEEWVESRHEYLLEQEYYLTERGKQSFIKDLSNDVRNSRLNAYRLTSIMGHEPDEEIVADFEDFLAHHRTVYLRTVRQWASGWGPKRPFDQEYGRVTVWLNGREAVGLARIEDILAQEARLAFHDDEQRDNPATIVSELGVLGQAYILNFEDVRSVEPLTDEDQRLIDEYKARKAKLEAEDAARTALWRAEQTFKGEVKNHQGMTLEEAQEVLSALDITEAEIPKVIAALHKVGIQSRIGMEQKPTPGLLL